MKDPAGVNAYRNLSIQWIEGRRAVPHLFIGMYNPNG
jgi:hypothetical protein